MADPGGIQRERIADVIGRNKANSIGIRKKLQRLYSLMRGPTPEPERKDAPRDSSIIGQSHVTQRELEQSSVMLDRMLEDFEDREAKQAGGEGAEQGIG